MGINSLIPCNYSDFLLIKIQYIKRLHKHEHVKENYEQSLMFISAHRYLINKSILINNLHRVAGTAGAVVTCPLEVVKTRLQSSKGVGIPPTQPPPSDNTANNRKICSKIPKHQVSD